MDSETWLDKAERLRSLLVHLAEAPPLDGPDAQARETIAIAVWLRGEFSPRHEEQPEQRRSA